MKIKKINEELLQEAPVTEDPFESEEEAKAADAEMEARLKAKAESGDISDEPMPEAEEISDETEEHIENTQWADRYRDDLEAIGMKEYKGAPTLMEVLDHFLYMNLQQKEDAEAIDAEDEYDERGNRAHTTVQNQNLLILGQPGTGKSAIIEEWIKSRHVRGVKFTGGELRQSVIQGLPFKTTVKDAKTGKDVERQGMLGSTAFDLLDTENGTPSILFIDEINRSMREAESAILTLVQSHTIPDKGAEGGERKFNDFLFTIAAANPSSGEDERTVRKLSLALKTRFTTYFQESSINETAAYLKKKLNRLERGNQLNIKNGKRSQAAGNKATKANKGRELILDALVDGGVQYATDKEGKVAAEQEVGVLNARTLENALMNCNGTVGEEIQGSYHGREFTPFSFLDQYVKNCGEAHIDEIIDILEPVAEITDVDDDANGFQKTYADKFNVWLKKYQRHMNR